MEERQLTVIVRAQTRGLIDYTKYRRYDIKWDLRENFIIKELLNSLNIESTDIALRTYSASLSGCMPGSEAAAAYQKRVFDEYQDLIGLVLPWKSIRSISKHVLTEASELWESFEEFQKTDEFKSQSEMDVKILSAADEDAETDRKLAELMSKKPVSRKILERKKFN